MNENGIALAEMQSPVRHRVGGRIAVVGAGPSGLMIAAELKKRGFRDITVFERTAQSGGKVKTQWLHGQPIELGAIWILDPYIHARALVREYGLNLDSYMMPIWIRQQDGGEQDLWSAFYRRCGGRPRAIIQVRRMLKCARAIAEHAGFGHVGPEFGISFVEFARRHLFVDAAEVLRPLAMACGYAYLETVPAAYFLKEIPQNIRPFLWQLLARPFGGVGAKGAIVREGYQTLWRRVAERAAVDIRFESHVTRIAPDYKLSGARVEFEYGRSEAFEFVFVASPACTWCDMLDEQVVTERRLSQIRSVTYRCTIAEAPGLADKRMTFLKENCFPHSRPGVISTTNYLPGSNLNIVYQVLPDVCSTNKGDEQLRADLADMGARECVICAQQTCSGYFPHVSPNDFATGFHQHLEREQGRHGIYLAGPLLGGESVEHVVEYAKDLVGRFAARRQCAPGDRVR
jgi:hypothetical protein